MFEIRSHSAIFYCMAEFKYSIYFIIFFEFCSTGMFRFFSSLASYSIVTYSGEDCDCDDPVAKGVAAVTSGVIELVKGELDGVLPNVKGVDVFGVLVVSVFPPKLNMLTSAHNYYKYHASFQ